MSGVATWVGSPDGRYEAELLDGRLVRLRLPGDLVDPSRSAQLEAELVSLLNEASGRDLDDLLADHEEKDDKRRYHLVERRSGTYMRRFALPFAPDRDKVTAEFDKGVLKVMVPRSPDQPKTSKRIEIKPAA